MTNTYVALLRGINVGGKNKLPMEGLRQCFADAGTPGSRTYIQSGNVVFAAPDLETAGLVCRSVEVAILERFGIKSPITLRSAAELAAAASENPFLSHADMDADTSALHVVFLAGVPEPSRAATLDPERSHGDEFRLVGRDLYLRLPSGVAGTKLTVPYFDSKLKTVGTQRNWRTVLALVGMCAMRESS